MAQIEVYPQKNGEWRIRRRGEGDKTESIGKAEERRDAVDRALADRQHGERVVLLRTDGSLYGELHHAESSGEQQDVEIEAAGEASEAS